jgi:transcriptional regulator NrdR family protein
VIQCPTCGARTSVVDTRDDRRRRECPAGHRFSTREIVADELKAQQAVDRKLAAYDRMRGQLAQIRKTLSRPEA